MATPLDQCLNVSRYEALHYDEKLTIGNKTAEQTCTLKTMKECLKGNIGSTAGQDVVIHTPGAY